MATAPEFAGTRRGKTPRKNALGKSPQKKRPRHTYYTLDENGEPVPCADGLAWDQWFQRTKATRERVVAQDADEATASGREPEVLVSTVFLAIDHNFWGTGLPVLWETMILGGPHDGYQRRYTSRAAALRGHQVACALMRDTKAERRRR